MKIRADFVTNSSSSSFIACGALSDELADFIIELLGGKTSTYSDFQVGILDVSGNIISVTTTLDYGNFYIHGLLMDDDDRRTERQKTADNKEANTAKNIASAFSAFLPMLTAEQKDRLHRILEETVKKGNTVASVYVAQTDGFEFQYFSERDFAFREMPRRSRANYSEEERMLFMNETDKLSFSENSIMDSVSRKAVGNFKGKIVRKDLTALMKRGANVPTYVLEYLLGMYCATDDEQAIAVGVQKIQKILTENYVHPEESEKIKSLIREKGEYTIIDKISAVLDEYNDCYSANFTNLNIGSFVLPNEYAVNYTKILMGGIWCMVRIAYKYPEGTTEKVYKSKRSRKNPFDSPFEIVNLKPIQMPNLNLEDIISKRSAFSTDEWIRLILRSAGIETADMNDKERFHFLERLVPLVERNYNLCELGPRGTGKSHIYKEISPYSILMSGGQTTASNLFFNLQSKRVGLVGHWDCIAFDEVAGMHFRDMNTIQIMKDYMASGSFARGRDLVNADASMVFVGNINDSVENLLKVAHLFEPFPEEFHNDSAFFDRIHYYLPGWEVPKIRSSFLTEEYGLITDCLAEFGREMRKRDLTHCIDQWFKLNRNVTTRDEIAIRKTISGLVKLIYPDNSYTKEDLEIIITYAIEGRRRVKEQLRRMAGEEFADVDLGYITSDGKEVIVYVPEQSVDTLIPDAEMLPGHIHAIGRSLADNLPAVYRMENKAIRGSGKMELQGVVGGGARIVKESIDAAWFFFLDNAQKVCRIEQVLDKDYLVYYGDQQGRYISPEVSVAEFVGLCSCAFSKAVLPSLAVIGELTLSGSIKEVKNISEYVRTAINAGAQLLLMPSSCQSEFDAIRDGELRKIRPIYYRTPVEAAKLALGL